jgi:hypothetical protein
MINNDRPADSTAAAQAHDRYLAELREMPAPWMPAKVIRSTHSKAPRSPRRKIIR